jgi:hypothetical protein
MNSHIIHTFIEWVKTYFPESLESVFIILPVTGYSYIPADWVSGRLEKILREEALIIF